MKKLALALLLLANFACTTHPHSEGRDEYISQIDQYSAGDKQFAGVYHNFEFRSTILNRKVLRTIHDRLTQYYDWDQVTSDEKWQETENKLNNKTQLWLSFFTPERKNDNLANKVSIWKIYLVAGNSRYEGQVRKANKNLSEAQSLFHYHNRWSTPYYVDFDVATAEVENENLKLIITGPLGRREVAFPKAL